MKTLTNILTLSIIFSMMAACIAQEKKIIAPTNLEEAISYFQQTWTKQELELFRLKDESTALADVHLSAGMWVRNEWVRGNRNIAFTQYFNDSGIYAPDDISSIVFISLHRRLNGKDIELSQQIEQHKQYWDAIKICEGRQKEIALARFNQHQITDTINIYMPVDTSSGNRNAVIYNCPKTAWTFNPSVDLKFSAIIIDKYHINSETNVFFKLKLLKMNFPQTQILMETVSEGSEIDLNLVGLKFE